jgi:glycine dehydrogenase subunit 1
MSYIPHTELDRKKMLEACGVQNLEDLFDIIPNEHRFPELNIPGPLSELEVLRELQELSESNAEATHYPCFLGAGAYHHYVPSLVNHMLLRGENLTAYTPYQPEVSQGTLQTMFEFQSMICALTGMEVANSSHYDGATSTAEAIIMALNHFRGKRTKIIISPTVHPHYRQVVNTYTQGMGVTIVGQDNLEADMDNLITQLDDQTAIFIVQNPNFLGELEDLQGVKNAVRDVGALLCVVANPISLGMITPPGKYGADIVVGEGQPLGIPMSYGGPYLGFFATREKYVRKMSGRLVGETVDVKGKRGYVLTLTPREQHIRRDKATSNICTNQGLMVTAAAIYLSVLGKQGLRQVSELCYHKAHYAAKKIDEIPGFSVRKTQPFFHEFAVHCNKPVVEINKSLFDDHGLIGGYDLGPDYPHLKDHMLLAFTEMLSIDDIECLTDALGEI